MENLTSKQQKTLGPCSWIVVRSVLVIFSISILTMPNISGIDALVNDSLVGMSESPVGNSDVFWWYSAALTWGAYVIGLLCSLFGYLYLRRAYSINILEESVPLLSQWHTLHTTPMVSIQHRLSCLHSSLDYNVVRTSFWSPRQFYMIINILQRWRCQLPSRLVYQLCMCKPQCKYVDTDWFSRNSAS